LPVRTTRKAPKRAIPTTPEILEEANVTPDPSELNSNWQIAVQAAEEKQAVDLLALDLRGVTSISDVFIICHGRNSRQNQAISDEIERRLKDAGDRALSIEGYTNAEWILMDYGSFVVHVFSEKAREYYALDRLYRDALALIPQA